MQVDPVIAYLALCAAFAAGLIIGLDSEPHPDDRGAVGEIEDPSGDEPRD